jgi:hypothetical protein
MLGRANVRSRVALRGEMYDENETSLSLAQIRFFNCGTRNVRGQGHSRCVGACIERRCDREWPSGDCSHVIARSIVVNGLAGLPSLSANLILDELSSHWKTSGGDAPNAFQSRAIRKTGS